MATLARHARLAERIDAYLTYSIKEWGAIPEIADEWNEWSDGDRLEFALEWPIRDDRLAQLTSWAKQGLLGPEQRGRYERLLILVSAQRPTLDRLFALQPSK